MHAEPQMQNLSAEQQAAKAIRHTLCQIQERPGVAWYLGHGTQTYALLTEAFATLKGRSITAIQGTFEPAAQPKFEGEELNQCPFCGSHALRLSRHELHDTHFVHCTDCNAHGPSAIEFHYDSIDETRAAARRKWNERRMPR